MITYSTTQLLTAMLIAFSFGAAFGVLPAVGCFCLCFREAKGMKRQGQALHGQVVPQERNSEPIDINAALAARDSETVDISDDEMICPTCWEDRHPQEKWWRAEGPFCIKHQTENPARERVYALVN